jgi:hypothetical protein
VVTESGSRRIVDKEENVGQNKGKPGVHAYNLECAVCILGVNSARTYLELLYSCNTVLVLYLDFNICAQVIMIP